MFEVGAAANVKRAASHWITPASLMASLWSQREPADRQRRDEVSLPAKRGSERCSSCAPPVCLAAGQIRKHTKKCAATHPCSSCLSCFAPAASLPNQRRCSSCLLQPPKSKVKDPLKAVVLSSRNTTWANAPAYPIERSVHQEEWNTEKGIDAGSAAVTFKHERQLMECH